jgi:zinc transport system substrate-binding protein
VRDARPLVIVSVLPQRYFVERIAGDAVEVVVMIPPGANPASHEPTIAQLRALHEARLVVTVGHPDFPFERAWLGALLAEAAPATVIEASAGVDLLPGDPHLWVSPRRARGMARNIAAALAELLPDQRETFEARLAALLEEIDRLDAELRDTLSPHKGGRFLVFHPAWGYLAADYGLEQMAIQRHGKDPDPRRLADLIREARQAGIEVVFAQPHFDPTSAEMIAAEIGGRVEWLDPLAPDWPDNLRRVARALARAAVP